MNYYISKNYRHLGSGGDKAKTDIESILSSNGFINAGLPQGRSKNAIKAYLTTLFSVLKGVSVLKQGDVLVLQYPLKKYYDFVVSMAEKRGAKVITLIHDLGSFRRKKLTVEEEIKRLNRSYAIVVHSPSMLEWLKNHGITTRMVILGMWDYLSPAQPATPIKSDSSRPRLVFAGDVSPKANGWIYRLAENDPDVDLILYGGNIDRSQKTPNMIDMGFVESDTLIASAQGDYGIVWYGSSLDEGAGPLGDYLQYNAPHKTSLYIRAGLPVIIWEKAALAPIVTQLGVGIAVPSLRDISKTLAKVTPQQYADMQRNAAAVARQLSSGYFFTKALHEALR
ncbi:MAG: galactofuranosyltransferase [Paramuribaculum sp.]|nr:galactofuranosyltransferase [Paramuribaculum sp.]